MQAVQLLCVPAIFFLKADKPQVYADFLCLGAVGSDTMTGFEMLSNTVAMAKFWHRHQLYVRRQKMLSTCAFRAFIIDFILVHSIINGYNINTVVVAVAIDRCSC